MTKSVLCRTNLGLDLFEFFHKAAATISVRGDALCVELPQKGDILWANLQLEEYGWEWVEDTSSWHIQLGQGVP